MRADARDNRARILMAADEVFGQSPHASTDAVAKLAGVGIATVFRHFPTKTDLLEAVLTQRLERLRQQALTLAAGENAGRAFYAFFSQVVMESSAKLAIGEALTAAGIAAGEDARKAAAGLREAFGSLLSEAQRTGAVRRDAGLPEVYALLIGASRGATTRNIDPEVRNRMLGLVYAGLRPAAA